MPTIIEALAGRAALVTKLGNLPPATLLTSSEAADFLGTSMGVLANWRSARRGPRYVGNGDFVRYRLGDLLEWMSVRSAEVPAPAIAGSEPVTSKSDFDAGVEGQP